MLFHPLSVGIIGGADGPTAIFVTTSPSIWLWLAGAAAAIIGLVVWLVHRKKR